MTNRHRRRAVQSVRDARKRTGRKIVDRSIPWGTSMRADRTRDAFRVAYSFVPVFAR